MNQKGVVHILPIIIILMGIVAGVYFIQKEGFFLFKPKASGGAEIIEALELTDANGNKLECDTSVNPPTCFTSTLDVNVKVKDKDAITTQNSIEGELPDYQNESSEP